MRALFIFCATALLAGCAQAPTVVRSDHDIVAGCLGWNVENESPRPAGLRLSTLAPAMRLEDARFVDIENGQCRNITVSEPFAFDTERVTEFSVYDLPEGRVGLVFTLTEPLGRKTYVGGTF